ncbi:unnamed protein product, partial [Closterium sp. NIES-54]
VLHGAARWGVRGGGGAAMDQRLPAAPGRQPQARLQLLQVQGRGSTQHHRCCRHRPPCLEEWHGFDSNERAEPAAVHIQSVARVTACGLLAWRHVAPHGLPSACPHHARTHWALPAWQERPHSRSRLLPSF